jgi:hypothetical protein
MHLPLMANIFNSQTNLVSTFPNFRNYRNLLLFTGDVDDLFFDRE